MRLPVGTKVKVKDGVQIGFFTVRSDGKVALVVGTDELQGNPNSVILDTPISGFKVWDVAHLEIVR